MGNAEQEHQRDEVSTLTGGRKKTIKSSELLLNKAVLLVLSEKEFGNAFVIRKREVVVGRNKSCDFTIDDPLVSNEHCKITSGEDGRFCIEDLHSTNATFINRKKLKKKEHLLYGDRIVIGDTIIRFYLEEQIEEK
ncbi:MAG: FHA domain-containing protein [Spirochaetales bacterium]|nr:FHA domain-containing protein [Spirochaetales bacterium]